MSISTQLNASFDEEDVDLFIYFHLMICLIMRTIMLIKPSYNINTLCKILQYEIIFFKNSFGMFFF